MVLSVFRPSRPGTPTPRPAEARRRLFRSSSSSSSAASTPRLPRSPASPSFFALPSSEHSKSPSEAAAEKPDLRELNAALVALAAVFPDVKPEVFREMLSTFAEESRLHVVAEQLLKHKAKWVKGRWRVPTDDEPVGQAPKGADLQIGGDGEGRLLVPVEEEFRREGYKRAARLALYQEFRGLPRSTVDGVLAECNYSYTLARPTLQRLAAKSWRNSLSTFFAKWKKPSQEGPHDHFMISWVRTEGSEDAAPMLKATGDEELESELSKTVLEPLLTLRREQQEDEDLKIAIEINEQQAEECEALHECECCFADTTFEQMATCTTNGHVICFRCLRHAVNEALFGQGWGKNIDHEHGQIKCLAPTLDDSCPGHMPPNLVHRAIAHDRSGAALWQKLESRLADEALLKAQIPLLRCPFCPYAFHDSLYLPPHTSRLRPNTAYPLRLLLALVLASLLLALLPLYTSLSLLLLPSPPASSSPTPSPASPAPSTSPSASPAPPLLPPRLLPPLRQTLARPAHLPRTLAPQPAHHGRGRAHRGAQAHLSPLRAGLRQGERVQ
ncbi:MAG: hypothetical protein FRX48_01900 [Lasallia pustulata]|uniref:RING-type domain-containing protein n=1 Tax=Lasallia pustulata TaxID=136370 RepID=A0A5M8Q0E8_9LECA|nr:MAG: hypothetical protein FRX48_01900 [Lasallia pustulata]